MVYRCGLQVEISIRTGLLALLCLLLVVDFTLSFAVRNRDMSWPEEMNSLVATKNFRERSNTGEFFNISLFMRIP